MKLTGKAVSKGIAIGKAFVFEPYQPEIDNTPSTDVKREADQFNYAVGMAKEELKNISDILVNRGEGDKAEIFNAHSELLTDEAMVEEIQNSILAGKRASLAVSEVFDYYSKLLSASDNPVFSERAADLKDVKNRILRCLEGKQDISLSALLEPTIILAHDLLPSDTAKLDRTLVQAIVTEVGGETSHSAIIARSYEIPAVLGVPDLLAQIKTGDDIIVDAISGNILLSPSEEKKEEYKGIKSTVDKEAEKIKECLSVEPRMKDGLRIDIHLNVNSVDEEELEENTYVDGVGLFRSEFLYMGKQNLPSEEEQFKIYKRVLEVFGDKTVTLRTLDIGGDKRLDCLELPKEENPFLGERGLRLCFHHLDMFKTQLRAAYRASVYGRLWIMFPMVESMDDIRRVKAICDEVKQELKMEGKKYSKEVKLGIMIEIPSIALIADLAAKEVDFASIGTNDLCQYLQAVDRMNPRVACYYQMYHPALFRLIGSVAKAFQKAGKPLSVCGEMAGNPNTAAALIGLGIHKLSIGKASIASIKHMLSKLSMEEAKQYAEAVINMDMAMEAEEFLDIQIG